jgi:hypothetical protein
MGWSQANAKGRVLYSCGLIELPGPGALHAAGRSG